MKKTKIVILSQFPNERIRKIALALKSTDNYHISLLCCEDGNKLYNKSFDEIYFFTFFDKLITFLKKRSLFYHIPFILRKLLYRFRDSLLNYKSRKFSSYFENNDYKLAYLFDVSARNLLLYKFLKNTQLKTIYDSYDMAYFYGKDILLELYENSSYKVNKELFMEKYCLEHADGFVMKFDEKLIPDLKSKGYQINGKYLYFADYCEPEYFQKIDFEKALNPDNFQLVYAGAVITEIDKRKLLFYSTTTQPVFSSLTKQKIKVSLFTNSISSKIYSIKKLQHKYKELYKLLTKGFTELHSFKQLGEFQEQISKYDFAINYCGNYKHYDKSVRFSNQNKLANYLEAGLPMVSFKKLIHVDDILSKYKIGISIDFDKRDELNSLLKNCNYQEMLQSIEKIRLKEYNLYENAHRLDVFIKEIIND